jgi:hypothetical protein
MILTECVSNGKITLVHTFVRHPIKIAHSREQSGDEKRGVVEM